MYVNLTQSCPSYLLNKQHRTDYNIVVFAVLDYLNTGDGNSIKKFYKFLKRAGFDISPFERTLSNKMFFELQGCKSDRRSLILDDFVVKPCVYKKR